MAEDVLSDDEFKRELTALIPAMRAFARTLCQRDAALADDLAQDGLLRAWKARGSFAPGTSMKAWTFMIVRNAFYSDKRRAWRTEALEPGVAENTLIASSNPDATLELDDLRRALALLGDEQREALVLVAAGELSYEEAAAVSGTAVGTVKSRVSRARDRLAELLANGEVPADAVRPSQAMAEILSEVEARRSPATPDDDAPDLPLVSNG